MPAQSERGCGSCTLRKSGNRKTVERAMTAGSGVVRSADSLAATAARLGALAAGADGVEGGPKSWQTTNLLQLGQVLTHVAALREETRGGHVRSDFPARDDAHWLGQMCIRDSASPARGPGGSRSRGGLSLIHI